VLTTVWNVKQVFGAKGETGTEFARATVGGTSMGSHEERDVERDEFSLRGDFGPPGSWCTFGDRPDFTRDYEWRFKEDRADREDWGRNDWGYIEMTDNYSGGGQTYRRR